MTKSTPTPLPDLDVSPDIFNDIKYVIPKEGDKPLDGASWADYFYESYGGIKDLQDLDLSKKEGTDKLHDIFNNDVTQSWDSRTLMGAQDHLVKLAGSGLGKNSLNNLESLVGIFDKFPEQVKNLALGLPSFYAEDSPEGYKLASQSIGDFSRISQEAEDPQRYISKKLKDFDSENSSHLFWFSYAAEVAQADVNISRALALRSLNSYGSPEVFLKDSLKTASVLSERVDKEELELQKAQKMLQEQNGGYLTAEQERTFVEDYKRDNAKDYALYEQAMGAKNSLPKMIGNVQSMAYSTMYSQKMAEEAKSKK